MTRSISPKEAAIVRWLLDHASVRDVTAYLRHPPEELKVEGPWCDCGCCSLRFQADQKGQSMLADALAVYDDGQQAGLILWGKEERITVLEVYDLHPAASHRVPDLSNLRTFEEHGRQTLDL